MVTTRSTSEQLAKLTVKSVESGLTTHQPQAQEATQKQHQQFLLFPKLPPELRTYVWGLVSSTEHDGRIVEISHVLTDRKEGNPTKGPAYRTNGQPHVMLNICHESRAEILKRSLWCRLEPRQGCSFFFNPLVDAIFLRDDNWDFHQVAHPGMSKVSHLIVNGCIQPHFLAQYPHLEILTVIIHQPPPYEGCKAPYTVPGTTVTFVKPHLGITAHCEADFHNQHASMDNFKYFNPDWKKPILNIMRLLVDGEKCCSLEPYANQRSHPWGRDLQTGSFWDSHCVPTDYWTWD
ncbi:hypothetical protein BKA61DRAFT_567822 [Leptodontidium sp. MPI-SDFR-AT-0119]|nr:hypothetical protein BKA61DRAFT_567822 [Leptodontidium sp. MPI-SDFR-AT-0119]